MSHTDIIIDADPLFEIDQNTRAIRNEIEGRNPIIQYDHNSERFGFSMARYVDGHDMSLCDKVEVHYINIDGTTKEQNEGVYEVKDLAIDTEDENKVKFTWLISQNATQYVGVLSFLIRFSCFEDTATPVYVWNTSVFAGITIAKGMYNSDVIVEQYADVLEAWENRLQPAEQTYNPESEKAQSGKAVAEAVKAAQEELKLQDERLYYYGTVEITPTDTGCFEFKLSEDSTYYTITKFSSTNLEKVVIPYKYNGLPVREIGEKAFWNKRTITSVVIPKSVALIGASAFHYCINLIDINIPDSVTAIDHGVFYGCSGLSTITLPNSITAIPEGLFYDCRGLKNIIIPESVTTIESVVFGDCIALTNVVIPESVTSIGQAFNSQRNSELKIQCEYGSAAHIYALENNIKHSLNSGVFVNEFGGEIFNDFENNMAYGKNSHAEGANTQSGHKGYKMSSVNTSNSDYVVITVNDSTLDEKAIDRYVKGDRIIFEGEDHWVDRLIIDSISSNNNGNSVITAIIDNVKSSYKHDFINADSFKLAEDDYYGDENWLCVAKKDYGQNILQYHSNHSEGEDTYAIGRSSHAEGRKTLAKGNHGHSEGRETEAGYAAHSEGYGSKALGKFSHAENHNCQSNGRSSHAEGAASIANGLAAHAEGQGTIAYGRGTHTEGLKTIAYTDYQHVEGKYNIEDNESRYLHIAGNGEGDNNRSNAYTLDWNGNAWHQGTVEASGIILRSSTPNSNKKFLLTVNDDGAINATEI